MIRSNCLQRIFFTLFIAGFFITPATGADVNGSADRGLRRVSLADIPAGGSEPSVTAFIADAADSMLTLQSASIYAPGHSMAAKVLKEEVAKRTGLQWPVAAKLPATGPLIILKEKRSPLPFLMAAAPALPARPEAFRLVVQQAKGRTIIIIEGHDKRGVMFGMGQLLRRLQYASGSVRLPKHLALAEAPEKALRGHQIGYRNLANSYDGWSPEQYEQYIRELMIFGANSIEAIPFQPWGPHFSLPSMDMNLRISEICKRYDVNFWVWTPATFDLNDAAKKAYFLRQFDTLFRKAARLDAVFFPGGDPGHNDPELVVPFLETLSGPLMRHHPKARIWLSLQGFTKAQCNFVYDYIRNNQPHWLAGLVTGPGSPPMEETRAALPASYKLRHYPDITHNVRCDFPVPWFDPAFAFTLGREAVNPRPVYHTAGFRHTAPHNDGFISYSDGAHDDVNKMIWSMLGWNSGQTPRDMLLQYTNFFFDSETAPAAADGILALERNWVGAAASNEGIPATLEQWQQMENKHIRNWRWQMLVMRAYYDMYARERADSELGIEEAANYILAQAPVIGADSAMHSAERLLATADASPEPALRERIVALCDSLFHSIALQTSVPKYKASGNERGAVLDFLDRPLNNRWFLEDNFKRIRQLPPAQQLTALDTLARWTNPGPGSFYDDVGNVSRSPHVVRAESLESDPLMLRSDNPGFDWWDGGMSRKRLSWMVSMRWPHSMLYEQLDAAAHYTVRVTGNGECLLRANGEKLTPTIYGKGIGEIKEFPVPQALTRQGRLLLTFDAIDEEHLNWRQHSRVTEVWLIKK